MKNSIKKSIFTAVLVATAAASWASKGTTLCIQNTNPDKAYPIKISDVINASYGNGFQGDGPNVFNGQTLPAGGIICNHLELEWKSGDYSLFSIQIGDMKPTKMSYSKVARSTDNSHDLDEGWFVFDGQDGNYIQGNKDARSLTNSNRANSCDMGERCWLVKYVDLNKTASTVIPGTEKVSTIPGTETLAQN